MTAGFHRRLFREVREWAQDGLITPDQRDRILTRYPSHRPVNVTNLIYLFAALLVGLGVVLLVAANWAHIARSIRLGVIILAVISAYGAGIRLITHRRNLGTGLLFLGTLLFGAGIWLVGQMYHLVYYDATGFLVWAAGTAAIALVIGSEFIYGTSLAELAAYGIASTTRYSVSWPYYPAFVALALPFVLRWPRPRIISLALISLSITTVVVIMQGGLGSPGLLLAGSVLAVLMHLIPAQRDELREVVLVFATGFAFWAALWALPGSYHQPVLTWVAPASLLVVALFVVRAVLNRHLTELAPVLAFFPYFHLEAWPGLPGSYITLGGMAAFSIALVVAGGAAGRPRLINLGSVYLLITVLVAYVHLAREFISGGLLFVSAGLVLFLLGSVLERGRRRLIGRAGGSS